MTAKAIPIGAIWCHGITPQGARWRKVRNSEDCIWSVEEGVFPSEEANTSNECSDVIILHYPATVYLKHFKK